MIPRKALYLALGFCCALSAGCASSRAPFQAERVVPQHWQGETTSAAQTEAQGTWWSTFASAELDSLMAAALADNFSLEASRERIEQARERLRSSRSVLFPQLDLGYGVNRADRWDDDGKRSGGSSDSVSASVGYEVDLWGGQRAAVAGARASLAATEFGHVAARLLLQAEIANAYFQWLATQDRLRHARESLEASREVLRLIALQHREGSVSRLELVQQEAAVASQEAQINDLANAAVQVEYALAVLTGQVPGTLALAGKSLTEIRLPVIAAEQPVELLERRPDLRQAEANLVAAQASVDTARAALLPGLRLSASSSFGDLILDGPAITATNIAAGLSQPLFQGGRLRAVLAGAEAGQREALANYYQVVLDAVKEVENNLADTETQARNSSLQERNLELSREAYHLADLRYRTGAADFLTLLDAQRSLIASQDSHVQFELSRYQSALELYRALGGSWWVEDEAPSPSGG